MTDPDGAISVYSDVPNPMPMSVRFGNADRLNGAARYNATIAATLGTLAEREIEDVSDAVFGRPSETTGLGSLGRIVLRKVLQISDYLQSVSAEGRSGNLAGAQILRR